MDRHAQESPERVAIIWERDEPGDTQYTTYRSARLYYLQPVLSPFFSFPFQMHHSHHTCSSTHSLTYLHSLTCTHAHTHTHTHTHTPHKSDSSQLLESTCRIANVLKREGVGKGDRVAIYMPASPLLAATMLACARIGAIHRCVHVSALLELPILHGYQHFLIGERSKPA